MATTTRQHFKLEKIVWGREEGGNGSGTLVYGTVTVLVEMIDRLSIFKGGKKGGRFWALVRTGSSRC